VLRYQKELKKGGTTGSLVLSPSFFMGKENYEKV